MNLLDETIEIIEEAGKAPDDIIFIGSVSSGHSCTWEEFKTLADFEYNNSYGGAVVAQDLEIVFKDHSRLKRGEYDGSEWWEYHPKFKRPRRLKPIERLAKDGKYWATYSLARLHGEEK